MRRGTGGRGGQSWWKLSRGARSDLGGSRVTTKIRVRVRLRRVGGV
ncbi:uncharacterized protein M6B38_380535 [Iris pallida]|uniref:Uncharacterized protein n=1 Tax=Iris pallida TaxID=29817 RepID=A0AAX6G9V4_IRIPA|nr:uncharacterized protein M6B38_380535 [Iris pallida]